MTGGDESWISPDPAESIDEGKKVKLVELIQFPLTFNPDDANACILHGPVEGEQIFDDRIPKFSDIHSKFKPMILNFKDYGYPVFQSSTHFKWIEKLIESIIPENDWGYSLSDHSIKSRSNESSNVLLKDSLSEIGPHLKSSKWKPRSTLALPEAIKSIQSLFSSDEISRSQISWSAVGIPLEPPTEENSNETVSKTARNIESSCQTCYSEQRLASHTETVYLESPLASYILETKQDNGVVGSRSHSNTAAPDSTMLRCRNEHRYKINISTLGSHGKTSIRRWLDHALECCHRLKQL